jgi:hypothetical protein
MKKLCLNYLTTILLCCLLNSAYSLENQITFSTDMSAMNILEAPKEGFIGKVLFIKKSNVDDRDDLPLNKLDYKIVQVTETEMIIYQTDKQNNIMNEPNLNLSDYLLTIKLADIDLPCNDYLYLCKLREFKRMYETKMPDVDFTANKSVKSKMGSKTDNNCLILTFGAFEKVDELAYLCFEDLEHLVFMQNLITDRVQKLNSDTYSGAVEMLNHAKNGLIDGILELKDEYMIYYLNSQTVIYNYEDFQSYAMIVYMKETIPWKGSKHQAPDSSRCFRIILITNEILYFCNNFNRNDIQRKHMLTTSNSIYVGNIFVSKINMKLHDFNLKKTQKTLLNAKQLDCDSSNFESIKYEIRLRVK